MNRLESGGDDLAAQAAQLWPTPMAGTPAQKGYNAAGNTDSSRKTVEIIHNWATPTVAGTECNRKTKYAQRGEPLSKQMIETHALWPTPHTREGKSALADPALIRKRIATGNKQFGLSHAVVLWATPQATDGAKGGPNMRHGNGDQPLPAQAAGAESSAAPSDQTSGTAASTSPGGQLNPEFVCWLMGFPDGWLSCEPSATP